MLIICCMMINTAGDEIPITELDENVVAMYVQESKLRIEQVFIPYFELFETKKVETLLLEDDDPATGLIRCISEFGIDTLVLGSYGSNYIARYALQLFRLLVKLELYVNVCTEISGIHLFAILAM